MKPKKILVSAGPIPARLDAVKYITNRFKGGLAIQTANYLSTQPDFEVTLLAWAHTDLKAVSGEIRHRVMVSDVYEYYDWIVANAKNFDAFVLAAAVANLTPVQTFEGKFPSHLYKPGDEFDIRFMIAPRAIDAVKPLNPRACLIGYKLFDEPDDQKLTEIAGTTLTEAKANLIFANTPRDAAARKLAVLPDGSSFPVSFDEHLLLMAAAIRQEYFHTEASNLTPREQADPDIREAMAAVSIYKQTFKHYGTVAVPVGDGPMFATTSRGHKAGPVLVRSVDRETMTVDASGKATLNAPALSELLKRNDYQGLIIHRHFTDPNRNEAIYQDYRDRIDEGVVHPLSYIFPGTLEEFDMAGRVHCDEANPWIQPFHGYLAYRPFKAVDWNQYHDQFPRKYFGKPANLLDLIRAYKNQDLDVLEIGGNVNPSADFSYDPYVAPDPGTAVAVSKEQLLGRKWPLIVSFNAINYLERSEIPEILDHCAAFAANTFREAPSEKTSENEYAVLDKSDPGRPMVRHGLRLDGDGLVRHRFHAYDEDDFRNMGLYCIYYGENSMIVHKGLSGDISMSTLVRTAIAQY